MVNDDRSSMRMHILLIGGNVHLHPIINACSAHAHWVKVLDLMPKLLVES